MNCYNSLRPFAGISKKLLKGHNFRQFKDHNSRRRYENKTNTSFFKFAFRARTVEKPYLESLAVRSEFCLVWFWKNTH